MEDTIISTLENFAETSGFDGKFTSYTAHLGMPAMHSDALESKYKPMPAATQKVPDNLSKEDL